MHIYIYAHIYIHIYIYISIHIYIQKYMHIHTYMHACIHTYMHTCVYMYIHVYTCIYIHIYIYIYIYIYIFTYTYIHTHTNINYINIHIYILNTRCIRFSILHGMIVFIDLTRILQPHHVLTVNGGGNWERTRNRFFHVCDILKNMHNSLTFSRKIDTCFRCFPQINLNAY